MSQLAAPPNGRRSAAVAQSSEPAPRSSPPPASTAPRGASAHGAGAVAAALATLAAATTLSAVLDSVAWWLLPAAGSVVVAAAGGTLARLVRLRIAVPAVLTVVPGLLGGLLYLTALSASSTARWGLLPTRATPGALRDVAADGLHDIKVLAPQVGERPGLVLLVAAGVLVVAVLVDLLAATVGRPATAGLPLLTLVAVPAAVAPHGVPGLSFALAALGYVGLLLTSSGRLESWGTVIAPDAGEVQRGRGAAGRRIGLGAVLVALVVPALLPAGLSRGWLSSGSEGTSTGSSGGGGPTLVVQPLVTIEQQLTTADTVPLLHVRTTHPEYLRLTALEQYDGTGFRLGRLSAGPETRVSSGMPTAADGTRDAVEASVVIEKRLAERYLPVPFLPTRVAIRGDWRFEAGTATILSTHTDTTGTRYTTTASVPAPTPAQLRAPAGPGSALPPALRADTFVGRLDPAVRALLNQLTGSAQTPYDAVVAIQAYLRSPAFHYDLAGAPAGGADSLRQFLLVDRRGYCQQFATAMTVLVRALGLPARVGVGFTQGVQQPDGSWLITNHDAHAWPEVWFPQTGWVRFEPTPRDDSTDLAPAYSAPTSAAAGQAPAPLPAQGAAGTAGDSGLDQTRLPSEDRAGVAAPLGDLAPAAAASHGPTWWLYALGVAAVLLLTAPVPAAVRSRRRRLRLAGRRPGGLSRGAWQEVRDTATDLGVAGPGQGTPRQLAARWSAWLENSAPGMKPDARSASGDRSQAARQTLDRLVVAEERRRFRPRNSAHPPAGISSAAVRDLLAALRDGAGRAARTRATLWPTSVVQPAAERTRSLASRVAAWDHQSGRPWSLLTRLRPP